MGLCYSLRPLLFGSSGDAPCEDSEPCAEVAQPSAAPAPAPAPIPAPAPVGTLLRRGDGRIPASARSPVELQNRRRQEQLRAEEREAAKEARKVSRGIDRMLREQKRDLQQTHRLLLLEIHLLPPNCWDQRHVLPHPARLFLEQLSVAMAEVQQLQVQEAVNAMVKSVERENIWKMQDLVFRCSANRCEGTQASMQQVHQCIEHCHAPVAQGQALVTSNLERFQDHLA